MAAAVAPLPPIPAVCTACRPILGGLAKRHAPEACPLSKGSYCGMCAVYGHSPATCPDRVTRSFRRPQFVEQFIPAGLLEEYGVVSCTPLPPTTATKPSTTPEAILEIPDTEEALRAAVLAAGGKPMICQEKGKTEKKELAENKKRLQKLADAKGQRVVFIAAADSIPTAAAKK